MPRRVRSVVEHRSRARRRAAARALRVAGAVIGAAVLVLLALGVGAANAVSYEAEEIAFVNILNNYRESLGLQPLMVSDLLSDAAEKHAHDLGTYGYGVGTPGSDPHITGASDYFPAGYTYSDRMAACGYSAYSTSRGENVAAGYATAASVFEAWRISPYHDPQLRNPSFVVVGVALLYIPGSSFGYYWVTDFGGYADSTAHWLGDAPTSSSTASTSTTTTSTTTTTTTVPPTTTTSTTTTSTSTTSSITTSSTTTNTTHPSTTTTVAGSPFTDVRTSSPFYGAICELAADGVISGRSDGMFYPDDPVTRAQFAKIIVLALGRHTEPIDNAGDPTFSDVPYTGDPYPLDYVEEAVALGIIKGFADGTFGPQANVTRLQVALMLVRAGGDGLVPPPAGYSCPFIDVPASARQAVRTALFNNLINGKTATQFDPYGRATRGQVAKMVYGLIQGLEL